MASNMWSNVEEKCEICGREIGKEQINEVTMEEDYLKGATIEDDDGQYLTICEYCLRLIVKKDWNELKNWE